MPSTMLIVLAAGVAAIGGVYWATRTKAPSSAPPVPASDLALLQEARGSAEQRLEIVRAIDSGYVSSPSAMVPDTVGRALLAAGDDPDERVRIEVLEVLGRVYAGVSYAWGPINLELAEASSALVARRGATLSQGLMGVEETRRLGELHGRLGRPEDLNPSLVPAASLAAYLDGISDGILLYDNEPLDWFEVLEPLLSEEAMADLRDAWSD